MSDFCDSEGLEEEIPFQQHEMHIVYGISQDGQVRLATGMTDDDGELIDYFTGMMMLSVAQQSFIDAWREENES